MSFRKEKKLRLSKNDLFSFKHDLISRGMRQLYPSRTVNSCYFDTQDFKMFFESEEGVLPRRKIRLRWYDSTIEITKETKISSIEGRYKFTEKIDNINSFDQIIDMHLYDQNYGQLSPSLLVQYNREYFSFEKMRLTFDSEIKYRDLSLINFSEKEDQEVVMEIKTSINTDDDFIENKLLHNTARFSKYSRGRLLFSR